MPGKLRNLGHLFEGAVWSGNIALAEKLLHDIQIFTDSSEAGEMIVNNDFPKALTCVPDGVKHQGFYTWKSPSNGKVYCAECFSWEQFQQATEQSAEKK